MIVRDLEAKDLTLIDPPILEPSDLDWYVVPPGMAWTVIEDGKILICGGIVGVPPKGRAWVLPSKAMSKRPILFYKIVTAKLAEIYQSFDVVEAAVHSDSLSATRWAQRMGFEKHGRIESYAGISDSYDGYVKNVRR